MKNRIVQPLFLFLVGGGIYFLIETLWRGYSHASMFLLGGICFFIIGLINEQLTFEMPLVKQQFIATGIITVLEFIFGVVLNIILKLDVWDYSHLPLNLLGQVSLYFSILWFFLSAVAIILDDYLRWWIFKEDWPHYTLFK